MPRLLDFLRGTAPDSEGRFLGDLWKWDDDSWEEHHDFIQWMFPLPEPSQFNPDAPVLSDQDIAAIRGEPEIQANLATSFNRFLTFLGLSWSGEGKIVEGPNLADRAPDVWKSPNHNWLRITRVLRCLTLLGLQEKAQAIFDVLEAMYLGRKYPISPSTFAYWSSAVQPQ